MDEHFQTNETQVSLKDQLIEALDKVKAAPSTEVREHQVRIIEMLDDSFVQDIHEELMDNQRYVEKFGGKPIQSEEELEGFICGHVFEKLVKIDIYDRLMKTPEQQEVAEEALDLFQHPYKYGIDKNLRNPDLTIVNVKTNEIVGVLDAKLGKLNMRAFRQMRSFERNIRTILGIVKSRRDAHNLKRKQGRERRTFSVASGISPAVANLRVAKNFKRFFVVPRGINYEDAELFSNTDEYTGEVLSDADKVELSAEIMDENIKFVSSPFSRDDITQLSNVVRERLQIEFGY